MYNKSFEKLLEAVTEEQQHRLAHEIAAHPVSGPSHKATIVATEESVKAFNETVQKICVQTGMLKHLVVAMMLEEATKKFNELCD